MEALAEAQAKTSRSHRMLLILHCCLRHSPSKHYHFYGEHPSGNRNDPFSSIDSCFRRSFLNSCLSCLFAYATDVSFAGLFVSGRFYITCLTDPPQIFVYPTINSTSSITSSSLSFQGVPQDLPLLAASAHKCCPRTILRRHKYNLCAYVVTCRVIAKSSYCSEHWWSTSRQSWPQHPATTRTSNRLHDIPHPKGIHPAFVFPADPVTRSQGFGLVARLSLTRCHIGSTFLSANPNLLKHDQPTTCHPATCHPAALRGRADSQRWTHSSLEEPEFSWRDPNCVSRPNQNCTDRHISGRLGTSLAPY